MLELLGQIPKKHNALAFLSWQLNIQISMEVKFIANTRPQLPYNTQPRLPIYTDPVLLRAAYELKNQLLVSNVT